MSYQALVTTIVSGVLGLAMLISVTALLISGVTVPQEFIPAMLLLIGVATGASGKAAP